MDRKGPKLSNRLNRDAYDRNGRKYVPTTNAPRRDICTIAQVDFISAAFEQREPPTNGVRYNNNVVARLFGNSANRRGRFNYRYCFNVSDAFGLERAAR